MIGLLKRKGFMGVFILASVPNMAFDLCGMCCGHFMMPFSTFFSAVLLGKAGVKASKGGGVSWTWTENCTCVYVCVVFLFLEYWDRLLQRGSLASKKKLYCSGAFAGK